MLVMAGTAAVTAGIIWYLMRKGQFKGLEDDPKGTEESSAFENKKKRVHILYGTTTGTARQFANTLLRHIQKKCLIEVIVSDLATYNEESLPEEDIVLFISSTWEGGRPPESCANFFKGLEDLVQDFRVSKDHLSGVRFAVFGLGGKVYGKHFCKAMYELDEMLERLGAFRLEPFTKGDDSSTLEQSFYKWSSRIVKVLQETIPSPPGVAYTRAHVPEAPAECDKKSDGGCCQSEAAADAKSGVKHNLSTVKEVEHESDGGSEIEEDEEDRVNALLVEDDQKDDNLTEKPGDNGGVVDMEEIGGVMSKAEKQRLEDNKKPPREMVTKLQYKALTKEGYKIIGSHSAVKLCRWTKNQLRGRGGCYKHSFYGITSYQCMEATPSLACANKCVFCWRHHKNPVGTDWRWKEDDPKYIVDEAVRLHVNMINQMKGVPGVQPSRLEEAYTVRHCALSLVGEPIMYPRINEMLRELHDRKISSFLVTNAQFPERIEQLDPVTQLYVSVDAATKDSLKAIDRPLFKDFWERFLSSLKALQQKKIRTVYRMTLVKSWNMTEVEAYVQLIEEGLPDFIEIKAVTYCGKSDASSLTMQNVPWHEEVCNYAEEICKRITERGVIDIRYSIATEHQHSCCILIAREDKFRRNGEWFTWIDYSIFHRLIQEYYESGGKKSFGSEDYMAKTPDWAVYQSKERGFDPVEQRWRRNKVTGAEETIPYEPSESGCG